MFDTMSRCLKENLFLHKIVSPKAKDRSRYDPVWVQLDFLYMNSLNHIRDESAQFGEHFSIQLLPV